MPLRLHMAVMLGATLAAGIAASKLLLVLALDDVLWRYPLIVVLSYAVFFAVVKLWLVVFAGAGLALSDPTGVVDGLPWPSGGGVGDAPRRAGGAPRRRGRPPAARALGAVAAAPAPLSISRTAMTNRSRSPRAANAGEPSRRGSHLAFLGVEEPPMRTSRNRPARGDALRFAARLATLLVAMGLAVGVIWALDVSPDDGPDAPRIVSASSTTRTP